MRLTYLDLSNNMFNGFIPFNIAMIMNIQKLNLSNNQLSGNIPVTIGNIFRLAELRLNNNRLNGMLTTHILTLLTYCVWLTYTIYY